MKEKNKSSPSHGVVLFIVFAVGIAVITVLPTYIYLKLNNLI
jgi:hypothetical protein